MTKRKYRSEIASAVHQGIGGRRRLGLVDKQTMREFDLCCLTTVEAMGARDVKALRLREPDKRRQFRQNLRFFRKK